MNFPYPIISVLFVLWAAQVVEADEGRALFNGKDLTGWQGMQGASYTISTAAQQMEGGVALTSGRGARAAMVER